MTGNYGGKTIKNFILTNRNLVVKDLTFYMQITSYLSLIPYASPVAAFDLLILSFG